MKRLSLLALVTVLSAASTAQAATPEASDRCESAVADAIRSARGKAVQDVRFSSEHRAVTAADDEEIGVKGEGRYRMAVGSVEFSYSCAFSPRSGRTSAVLFREAGGPPSLTQAGWQPDLENLNPVACETSVAAALKKRHPRVTGIQFSGDSRRLLPAQQGRTAMEGAGQLRRAEGMTPRPFSYRCEFERGSSRIARADTTD